MAAAEENLKITKEQRVFEGYIKSKRILIADSGATSRAGLSQVLINLGAKSNLIKVASSLPDALTEMESHKPEIVICDYDLGGRCGLDLLQSQRKQHPEMANRLFVLVTGNTSQTAVARAAEEDVDCYVLKPFTPSILRQTLLRTALAKIQPSPYHQKIEEGKKLLFESKADEAIAVFRAAKALDKSPSLACFYEAQAELVKKALKAAEGDLQDGLQYNKIHYKCMTGLFDLLLEQKRFPEAYDVAKRISQYFPANPERLTQVLKLAIQTGSYDDVERYYQMFCKIDERNEEVNKYVCAALIVCGKYYLQKNLSTRALELFSKAAITGAGRTKVLSEIILSLAEQGLAARGPEFLKRFPPDQQTTPLYAALEVLILNGTTADPGPVIAAGRAVFTKYPEIKEPFFHELLIRRYCEAGLKDAAETHVGKATALVPAAADRFKKAYQPKK